MWRCFINVAIMFALVVVCVVAIAYCTAAIVRRMRSAAFLALRTRTLQRQLFRALLLQTAIPLCFSYLPMALIYALPMMRISGGDGSLARKCIRQRCYRSIRRTAHSRNGNLSCD